MQLADYRPLCWCRRRLLCLGHQLGLLILLSFKLSLTLCLLWGFQLGLLFCLLLSQRIFLGFLLRCILLSFKLSLTLCLLWGFQLGLLFCLLLSQRIFLGFLLRYSLLGFKLSLTLRLLLLDRLLLRLLRFIFLAHLLFLNIRNVVTWSFTRGIAGDEAQHRKESGTNDQ